MSARKPRRSNSHYNTSTYNYVPHNSNNNNNNNNNFTDYESDAAYLSDMPQQPQPALPLRSNEELNISVLRRHNPSITSVLSLANYAVVYLFNSAERQWEKTGTEGTMFVCQRTPGNLGEERYSVFVLNRRGLSNFDLPLTDSENIELTEEYVILKSNEREGAETQPTARGPESDAGTGNVRIYGIWIYSEPAPNSTAEMRAINAQLIQKCAAHAGQSLKQARDQLESARQIGMHIAAAAAESQTAPLKEIRQDGVPMDRQISLQDLFGQQRAQDDEWTVRAHHLSPFEQEEAHPHMIPPPPQPNIQQQPAQNDRSDVLGDLFRKAGLTYQTGGQV